MAAKIRGITIELGADTQGLEKALVKVNGEIGKTQKELRDVERLLKMDPGNTELLAQKHRILGDRVTEAKEKIENLKKAQEVLEQEMADGKIDQGQYDALTRELISCENELKNLERQAAESSVALQKIGLAGESLKNLGSGIESAGQKFMPVTAAITGLGVATGKMAIDFEDAMAKVSTIADESEVPIDEMKDAILNLSNETGIAAGDIADNVYNAISAGQKTGDAVAFVGEAAKLAKAGFAESGDALDILTTIMNSYGLKAEEVTKVSDMLIQTQNLGKTTVAELSSAMGKVIPTAKAQGVQLDSLAASYAVMTSNGIATAETTTYLNSMLNELGKQGTSASKAFAKGTEDIKEGGLTMAEAMESGWELTDVLAVLDEQAKESGTSISNMFGSAEAGKAATVLMDNANQLTSAVESMRDSAGATGEAFEKLDTTSNQMNIAMNEVKNAGIELGEAVMTAVAPVMEKLADAIKQLTEWFSSLDDSQKQTIVQIGALVAAIGPALIVIGNIVSAVGSLLAIVPQIAGVLQVAGAAFKALWAIIMANPIVAVTAAVVGFVMLIATKGDEIQALLQKLDDFLQNIFAKDWKEVFGPVIGQVLNNFFQNVKNIWDSVKKIFDGIIDFIRGVFTGDWNRAWKGIQEIFGGYFEGLVALAKAPINNVITLINGLFSGINSIIGKVNSMTGSSFGTIDMIPLLAKGGTVTDGSAIVGEAGAELLTVSNGAATVQPLSGGNASHTDITDLLKTYLPYLAEGNQLFLDTGVLVGATASAMNNALGRIAAREGSR